MKFNPNYGVVAMMILFLLLLPWSRSFPTNLVFLTAAISASSYISGALLFTILRGSGISIFFLRDAVRKSSANLEITRSDEDPRTRTASQVTLSYGGFDAPLGISTADRDLYWGPAGGVEQISEMSVGVFSPTIRTVNARTLRALAGRAAEVGEGSPQGAFNTKKKSASESRVSIHNPFAQRITVEMENAFLNLVHTKSGLVDLIEKIEVGSDAANLAEVDKLVKSTISKRSGSLKTFFIGEPVTQSQEDKPRQQMEP